MFGSIRYSRFILSCALVAALSACGGGRDAIPQSGTSSQSGNSAPAAKQNRVLQSIVIKKPESRAPQVFESPNPMTVFPSTSPPSPTFQGYIDVSDATGGVNLTNYSCQGYLTVTGGSGGTAQIYNVYSIYAPFSGSARTCKLLAYGNSGEVFVTVNIQGNY